MRTLKIEILPIEYAKALFFQNVFTMTNPLPRERLEKLRSDFGKEVDNEEHIRQQRLKKLKENSQTSKEDFSAVTD